MNNSLKLLLVGAILAIGMGASTANAALLDAVRDTNGTPVLATAGDCLRSNWMSDSETCTGVPNIRVSTDRSAVYFAFGSSALTAKAKRVLRAVAKEIKANPSVTAVRIAGYADRVGSATANEKLSKRRADRVRRYLMAKGVVNAQVAETRWFGASAAATSCKTDLPKADLVSCLQPDRRVEVEIDAVRVK